MKVLIHRAGVRPAAILREAIEITRLIGD